MTYRGQVWPTADWNAGAALAPQFPVSMDFGICGVIWTSSLVDTRVG